MPLQRHLSRIVTTPPLAPGFVGEGHLASHVISVADFERNDPFIMLADDHLDIGDRNVGGPHPHAGFETVTLLLDGALYDAHEGGDLGAGSVQWMTAGKGIVHGEHTKTRGPVRLLQLWLTLPKAARWAQPGFQNVQGDAVVVRREPGVEARIYSGASGGLRSATRNHTPATIVEFALAPAASVEQELPASYNGFLFPVDGEVRVGDQVIGPGRVGWLDRPEAREGVESVLRLTAGAEGARVVLYAGQPQRVPIVSYGPFIGDTEDDIRRLFREYRAGEFPLMSQLTVGSGR
jgi:hypothetical protein